MNDYSRGSEWGKWDLHIHTPISYDWDSSCKDDLNSIIDKSLKAGLSAIAITDHHSVASIDQAVEYGRNKGLLVIPGIELRTDKGNKKIHIIGLFDPAFKAKTIYDKILCQLGFSEDDIKMKGNEQIYCPFESACEKIHDLGGLVMLHAGNKSNGIEQLDSDLKSLLKTDLAKQVDIFEVNTEKQESDYKDIVFPKIDRFLPCVMTSDSAERKTYKRGHSTEGIGKKYSYIKSNCTFEGLKQILYEPRPGERVCLKNILPDEKDSYRVIDKIVFKPNDDFPEEVIFNRNLCSIIGSRSSGKSALLAYIADSIDRENTRKIKSGPGDGIEWKEIKIDYYIKWANGKTNDESPGSVVFIPQNYLFDLSKNPEEIKARIEPVLFKVEPEFMEKYHQCENQIISDNNQISTLVDKWFSIMEQIDKNSAFLTDLGNKKSVNLLIESIKSRIAKTKKQNSLSKVEVEKYQKVKSEISTLENKIISLEDESTRLSEVSDKGYFSETETLLTPSCDNFPLELRNEIAQYIDNLKVGQLIELNKIANNYKKSNIKKIAEAKANLQKTLDQNKNIIDKYKQISEIQKLVDNLNSQQELIKSITTTEQNIEKSRDQLIDIEDRIDQIVKNRFKQISDLSKAIKNDQSSGSGSIKFGIEYGIDEVKLANVSQKINLKENSDFVKSNVFELEEARRSSRKFLVSVQTGSQKINAHNTARDVCKAVFQLTEKILFTAEMEEDKIGGFFESTMTPGKRALFALRLILSESEGSWPLLIDQPEDDLDSRSIFKEIVPFIKEKKKQRQILLVSHNANMVIGSDSEQIIVANKHGDDRNNENGKQFNYRTGSIENNKPKDEECKDILSSQGIREHACDILDGGEIAFENRINKYCLHSKKS
jgi:ABC-type branched-subunit amino acid transport system ATPase component